MRALTCLNLLFFILLLQQMAHLVIFSLKLSYTTAKLYSMVTEIYDYYYYYYYYSDYLEGSLDLKHNCQVGTHTHGGVVIGRSPNLSWKYQ